MQLGIALIAEGFAVTVTATVTVTVSVTAALVLAPLVLAPSP